MAYVQKEELDEIIANLDRGVSTEILEEKLKEIEDRMRNELNEKILRGQLAQHTEKKGKMKDDIK